MGKTKKEMWCPSSIDYSLLTMKDFESFGGIEELTDYKLVSLKKEKKIKKISGKIKKKKVSKKIKKMPSALQCNVEEISDSTQDLDMADWVHLHVPNKILNALKELKFEKPTQIQELVLPSAIRDHLDILAAAETGSGKTLAFGIPIISHIMATKERENSVDKANNTLRGLVLTPTRELAIQVKNHLLAITKDIDVKIMTIVGGMSQEKQQRLLRRSPDIIVATPGRLWQLMQEGVPYLQQIPHIRYLVIDEADRMVEQGHYEELTKLLEILNENKKSKRRQNFIFSATLMLVHDLPKRLELKRKKVQINENQKLESLMTLVGIGEKPKIIDITRKTGIVETLTESQIMCSKEEKDVYLYYFVTMYPGRTLVFCNSINSVRRLKSIFENLDCNPLALHASMHQRQRLKNLEAFAASDQGLLLATDVAARGLDIRGIEHVVHFQVPRTAEIYVHRSGRTARAQHEGLSLMLIEPQDGVFYKKICKTLNKDRSLPSFPVDFGDLKVVKERVMLAREIDQLEHKSERSEAQNRWFINAAKEMEMEIDDKQLLNELGNERERSIQSQKLKSLKKQLNLTIKKPIVPRMYNSSYPTKSGKLLVPTTQRSEKALDVIRDPSKVASTFRSKKKGKRNRRHRKGKS